MRLRSVLITSIAAAMTATAVVSVDAGDRKDRQVRAFESALDAMLVDSPNWLVQSTDPTHGRYVKNHGAVFSFKASLVGNWDNDNHWWQWWDDDDDDRRYDRDDRDEWEAREMKRMARRYRKGQEELVETLIDFGEILSSLDDDDIVEIDIRFRRSAYFREAGIRELNAQVSMGDLRSYYDDTISEDELASRIKLVED